ncbi:hypothetical protein EB796_023009 [Bugula neritina]|uniref:Uncharacterized protein n=1 Tax=Bugula neritina TaxID=10212 RepID=A0A7J7IXM9_BUGNE|nr:hypothetical protein EB796_023009 [Bugula neritina]
MRRSVVCTSLAQDSHSNCVLFRRGLLTPSSVNMNGCTRDMKWIPAVGSLIYEPISLVFIFSICKVNQNKILFHKFE